MYALPDPARPPARTGRLILIGAVALVGLGGGIFALTHKSGKSGDAAAATAKSADTTGKPDDAKKEEVPDVTVIVPGQTAVRAQVTITGTLAAREELPVMAEDQGGRIDRIYADIGDRVAAGAVLATLTTDMLKPQIAQLVASLEEARATADLARADLERAQSVADTGAISREELDRRKATAATAAARAKVVAAQLAEAKVRLARTEIRAPAAGVVLMRKAEIGQMASPAGEPLFRLARNGAVELRGQIAEQDLPQVRVGQEVQVRLTGMNEAFTGRIWQLGAVIDSRTRQGSVRIELPRSPKLRAGAFAQAVIEAGGGIAIVLPQSAIQSDAGGSYVFAVGAGNKIVRRDIKTGAATPNGVTIAEGLNGTEKIVATSAAFLRVGEQIAPILRKA